jgi:hypothetical protein
LIAEFTLHIDFEITLRRIHAELTQLILKSSKPQQQLKVMA